jgi:hypothetical protein
MIGRVFDMVVVCLNRVLLVGFGILFLLGFHPYGFATVSATAPLLVQAFVWPVLVMFLASIAALAVCYFYWKGNRS